MAFTMTRKDFNRIIKQREQKILQMQKTINQLQYDCELYKDYIRMMENKKNMFVGKSIH